MCKLQSFKLTQLQRKLRLTRSRGWLKRGLVFDAVTVTSIKIYRERHHVLVFHLCMYDIVTRHKKGESLNLVRYFSVRTCFASRVLTSDLPYSDKSTSLSRQVPSAAGLPPTLQCEWRSFHWPRSAWLMIFGCFSEDDEAQCRSSLLGSQECTL